MSENRRMTVNRDGSPCYDIVYADSFDALPAELEALGGKSRRICVITDDRVEALYGREVLARVLEICPDARMCVIPQGEEHKNLDTMAGIYRFLIENGYDRKSLLVARRRRRRHDGLCGSDLSQRGGLCSDPHNASGPGGFLHRRKDRDRF